MNVTHHRHGEGQQAFSHLAVAMETDYTESVFFPFFPPLVFFSPFNVEIECQNISSLISYLLLIKITNYYQLMTCK